MPPPPRKQLQILSTALHLLAVVPAGMVLRLLRVRPLDTRFDRSATSYWEPVKRQAHDPREPF